MLFMFKDKYINITDVDFLFSSSINSNNFLSVDQDYLSSYNLFLRRQYIESAPF